MELLTDILAIAGWAVFGHVLPILIIIYRDGSRLFDTEKHYSLPQSLFFGSAAAFGLIAASLVLG